MSANTRGYEFILPEDTLMILLLAICHKLDVTTKEVQTIMQDWIPSDELIPAKRIVLPVTTRKTSRLSAKKAAQTRRVKRKWGTK